LVQSDLGPFLVAGTPIDGDGAKVALPPVPAAIPGSCGNPIHDPTAVGVQFIFGGDGQMMVKAGQAEICALLRDDAAGRRIRAELGQLPGAAAPRVG
jgi:hypothetical protein